MKKRLIALLAVTLALCAGAMGCEKRDMHEAEVMPNVVRIYDVESQDRSRMLKSDYDLYLAKQLETASSIGSEQELAARITAGYEGVAFTRHEYRMGIFTGVMQSSVKAPFRYACNEVSRTMDIDVEYVLMGSWEEVRAELENTKDDGVTKIVLFNNSYDESILNELRSGRYADMEQAMEAAGLYNEEVYDQAVMKGGRVDGVQFAVPLLYNVSGMIQGETNTDWLYDESLAPLTEADYELDSLSYEDFIAKLKQAMKDWDSSSMDMPFLSAGFIENEPDLFLLASGIDWADYEGQEELFELLLNYRKMYQETQIDVQNRGMSNQQLHMMYLKSNERLGASDDMAEGTMEDLESELDSYNLANVYLERTKYFVECSTVEDIAFHSILGTLNYSRAYCTSTMDDGETEFLEFGRMDYWPIGISGDSEAYAAQLVSYAAVVDGGDTELAASVLQEMLGAKTLGIYGLSPCIEVRNWQISGWSDAEYYWGEVRSVDRSTGEYVESTEQAFWNSITGRGTGGLARTIAAQQLQEQLAHVVTAQIPDRTALSIWQDTLTEAVDSGLSAEAGFELLCERMDEWYTK